MPVRYVIITQNYHKHSIATYFQDFEIQDHCGAEQQHKNNSGFSLTLKEPRQRGLAPGHETATSVLPFQGLIWKIVNMSMN